MKLQKISPPKNKKELFDRILAVIEHGEYTMSAEYNGHGAPGDFLEDLIGLRSGNMDIPDSIGWEVKWFTAQTSLITLFHKEPSPEKAVRFMVSKWGWKDKLGRLSFRHTIKGKTDRFEVKADSEKIIVRRIGGNGVVPSWTYDDILGSAGAKLRRLMLVKGVRKLQKVTFKRVDCFEDLYLMGFIESIVKGTIAIDFDAREMKPGSVGLRNHGTKFRVAPEDVCRLYSKKMRLS